MKFKEWLKLREDNWDWGGAAFDGTSNVRVNTPDYPWAGSKYQGHTISYGEPSNLKKIRQKFKIEPERKPTPNPIEDRVPKDSSEERDKEERYGNTVTTSKDPLGRKNSSLDKVNKMFGHSDIYVLKNMPK